MLRRRTLLLGVPAALAVVPGQVRAKDLWQPSETTSAEFLARAIDLAHRGSSRGDGTPYGAIIVRAGLIVGEGWNRSYVNHDATAHAETEAIRDACHRLGTRSLSDCILYTNGGRPCPMCETAAYFAEMASLQLEGQLSQPVDAGPPIYGGC